MSATPNDIAVELGRTAPAPTSTEYAQWELWIADALFLIGKRLGDVAQLDQPTLDYVVRQAVSSHVKRPDDATQVEVSVDDGRTARTYRSAKGRVEIIDEWWDLLSPPNTSGRAFSVQPVRPVSAHLPWCDLMFGGVSCSCGVDIAGRPIYELSDEP